MNNANTFISTMLPQKIFFKNKLDLLQLVYRSYKIITELKKASSYC